jgi:hypothetical protein
MALPYPNPSLSEMAVDDEFRDGAAGRASETQPQQPKPDDPPKKMALRHIVLTIMCVPIPVLPRKWLDLAN